MNHRKGLGLILLMPWLIASASAPVIDFVTPGVVRVRWNVEGTLCDNATGACVYPLTEVATEVLRREGTTVYRSSELEVEVPDDNGGVIFRNRHDGRVLLRERQSNPRSSAERIREKVVYDDNTAHIEETANGKVTVKDILRRDTVGTDRSYTVTFSVTPDEALYGLGSHMEDYMNLQGKTLYLTQHNMKAFVPVIVSTGGYGLMFDAGCSMRYDSTPDEAAACYDMEMEMLAAKTLDYYFIKGDKPEDVVAGYRYLTGAVSMPPRYLFGYIQSKERYVSSEDIVNTVREYRRRQVPLDMIVQDWNYWPEGWGYAKMDRRYYPDPKALADSVHAYDARLMVSVWPNPQYCPQERDMRERGYMLEHSVYDVFSPEARDCYWEYVGGEFFDNGFDAWWCDSSEPLDGDWNTPPEPVDGRPYSWEEHKRRWELNNDVLSETLGSERACLYSLYHSKGIYEHQRHVTDAKRVVNLTRSTFAGQQRYGTIVWNGDTHASWQSFRQQIPSGLNYMAAGSPYWTVDVGCFFTRTDPRWFYKGEFPAGMADEGYKEFYTRMFQWGTFLPVLRSHGTDTPREIWQLGEAGTPYYDAVLKMINLRYSLLPYIYSMAAAQTVSGYSMARPLGFDFPADRNVLDLKDQYMFGDIMVCPVTSPGVNTREVYLPESEGGWIDFWTGKYIGSGTVIMADTPIDRLPLYVRGGSILLSTEPVQHTGAAAGQPVTVEIYPGQDADFTFYDDAGDGYAFEKGNCTRIKMRWDERKNRLTIAEAEGNYKEAPGVRVFNVRKAGEEKTVHYTGKRTEIKF